MCDLSDTESFEDIVTALKNYLEKNQIDENGMIFATGYDHNFLAEQKHPDKTVLDKVSKTVPIYISHASGHMGAANSGAAKACGNYDRNKHRRAEDSAGIKAENRMAM